MILHHDMSIHITYIVVLIHQISVCHNNSLLNKPLTVLVSLLNTYAIALSFSYDLSAKFNTCMSVCRHVMRSPVPRLLSDIRTRFVPPVSLPRISATHYTMSCKRPCIWATMDFHQLRGIRRLAGSIVLVHQFQFGFNTRVLFEACLPRCIHHNLLLFEVSILHDVVKYPVKFYHLAIKPSIMHPVSADYVAVLQFKSL